MPPDADNVSQRVQQFSRLETRLAAWPLPLLAVGLLLVAIAKVGVTFRPFQADPVESFPIPRDTWAQLSYGMRTVHWLTKSESLLVPSLTAVLLLIISLGVAALAAHGLTTHTSSRILLIALVLGPAFTVFLSNMGRPDGFTLTGALLLGLLGRSTFWGVVGAALMIAGNPEQAVIGAALLLGLTFLPHLASWRRSAAIALSLAITSYIALATYARSVGVGSRVQYLPELIGNSVYGFSANLSLGLYAGYAVLWLALAVFAWQIRTAQVLWVFLLMVIIPVIITAATLDQTRVFVGITTSGIAAILVGTAPSIEKCLQRISRRFVVLIALATALFLPAFEVSSDHVVRPPLAWLYSNLISWIS